MHSTAELHQYCNVNTVTYVHRLRKAVQAATENCCWPGSSCPGASVVMSNLSLVFVSLQLAAHMLACVQALLGSTGGHWKR